MHHRFAMQFELVGTKEWLGHPLASVARVARVLSSEGMQGVLLYSANTEDLGVGISSFGISAKRRDFHPFGLHDQRQR